MDMHNVRWPGWQAVRPLGGGNAGEVFEIQHHSPGGIESGVLKVMRIPRNPEIIRQQLEQGNDPESVKQKLHARMEGAAWAYNVMHTLGSHPNVLACEEPGAQPMADGFGWELTVKTELLQSVAGAFPGGASQEQVLTLGLNVATALVLCHQQGLIHEGVKASNVFVTAQGCFKLGDFGAARASGMPCGGDLLCMPPEVYWGMGYDCRADVYGLGVLMYTLLNGGCLPLTGPEDPEQAFRDACVRRLSGEELPLPANGSEELTKIVMRACAYEPAKRYGSVEELRAELLALMGMDPSAPLWPMQSPQPVQGGTWRPEPVMEQSVQAAEQKPAKKNGVNLFLILAVAAAVLVVGVVCFFTVHIWSDAICNEVPKCVICGKTAGKAEGHHWESPTCVLPETCAVCGETEGEPLGHQWLAATRETPSTCSVCGEKQGDVLRPTLWVMKLISSGWLGGHRQSQEGQTVLISFPEDPGFVNSQMSAARADGTEVEGFTVEWADGTAKLEPNGDLEPGVYHVQFRTEDAGAMVTVCWGYEGEEYLSAAEHFWSGVAWQSDAHGGYLTLDGGEVSVTDNVGKAAFFESAREMVGVTKGADGKLQVTAEEPVQLETVTYARNGQDGLVVFVYEGCYLACDSQGTVYMSQQLDENCFWTAGR